MTAAAGLWIFLQETWQRLFQKSPKYFVWWNRIYMFIIVVPQIPTLLAELGIDLPTVWDDSVNRIISIAGIIGYFMSKLTAKDALSMAADPTNNKMPFTAAKDLSPNKN